MPVGEVIGRAQAFSGRLHHAYSSHGRCRACNEIASSEDIPIGRLRTSLDPHPASSAGDSAGMNDMLVPSPDRIEYGAELNSLLRTSSMPGSGSLAPIGRPKHHSLALRDCPADGLTSDALIA